MFYAEQRCSGSGVQLLCGFSELGCWRGDVGLRRWRERGHAADGAAHGFNASELVRHGPRVTAAGDTSQPQ